MEKEVMPQSRASKQRARSYEPITAKKGTTKRAQQELAQKKTRTQAVAAGKVPMRVERKGKVDTYKPADPSYVIPKPKNKKRSYKKSPYS